MNKYSCKCGYTVEHFLTIRTPCPKCGKKLKYLYEPVKTHHIEKEDLPLSTRFIPIYYQDQLWYFRRSPRNTKKAQLKALHEKFKKKL